LSSFFVPLAERTVESLHSSLSEIKKAVAGQELSQVDVDRLAARKAALREEHASLQQGIYEAKQQADQAEVSLKKSLQELSSRLQEYNQSASKLQLLPSTAKYAFGLEYQLKLNESYLRDVGNMGVGALDTSVTEHGHGAGEGNTTSHTANFASATTTYHLLGNDVKGAIKPNLRELKGKMIKQANEHSKLSLELADSIQSMAEAIVESQKAQESLTKAIKAKEDALAAAKQEHEAALQQQQGMTETLTQQLSKTRQELSAVQGSLGGVKEDAVRSEALKLKTYIQVLNDTRMRARLKFQDCIETLARHKDAVVDKLEGLRAKVQAKRDAELAAPPARETIGGARASGSSVAASSTTNAAVMAAIAQNKAARLAAANAGIPNATHGAGSSSITSNVFSRLPPTPYDDTAPLPSTSTASSSNPVMAAVNHGRVTIGGVNGRLPVAMPPVGAVKVFVAPPTVPAATTKATVVPATIKVAVPTTAATNRHLRFEEEA
jgi:hypothetical protein